MFKKAIASLLVFLLSVQPVGAADNFAASLKSMLLQSVSEGLAKSLDVASGSAAAERALTTDMQIQARTAAALFATAEQPNVDLYDPADLATSKAQLERWRAFSARTTNKRFLNDDEVQEAAGALLPFLRYYIQGDARKPVFSGNMVIVPAGKTARLNLQGYCMDRSVAVPASGEKLQLVPIENLLPAEGVPLYQAMMQFAALHVEKRSEIQNLVWGLRHAADPYPPIKELNSAQVTLLDTAMPRGAATYLTVLATQARKGQATEARKKLFRDALGAIQNKFNVRLPDPSASGYTPNDANALIAALTRMPVEGVSQDNSEYSMLAPSVASRVIASGLHDINVEIKNATPEAYVFDASKYAGQSTRVTQRVAFGGLLRDSVGHSALNIPQRLQDILKLLEIEKLKKLQAQIQNSIDGLADGAGRSNLTLASLALATAVNQVLLPTTVLDVALLPTGGKLFALTEKIGFKEVVAVERAAADAAGGYKGGSAGIKSLPNSSVEKVPVISVEKPNLLDRKAEIHVLEGDVTGGGHRPGTGYSGKSEFPSSWTDDKIKGEISEIASSPLTKWSKPDNRGYVTGSATRDGVEIKVVYDTKGGRIVTGYPINLDRNP